MEDESFDDDEMLAEMLGSSGGDLDLEGILADDDLPPLTDKVSEGVPPVSYTHLTLPTIYSV